MKPRIYKRQGIWHCYAAGITGLGYTPRLAYLDWLKA